MNPALLLMQTCLVHKENFLHILFINILVKDSVFFANFQTQDVGNFKLYFRFVLGVVRIDTWRFDAVDIIVRSYLCQVDPSVWVHAPRFLLFVFCATGSTLRGKIVLNKIHEIPSCWGGFFNNFQNKLSHFLLPYKKRVAEH